MLWKTWSTKGADGVHLSKKGKNIFSDRFAKMVKRAFKELIEREISVNPPPTSLMPGPARDALSLESVDKLVGDHLKSSTWPFHYLCLLQFVKFKHHCVLSFWFCPRLSQYRDKMFLERSRWGQACSSLTLVHSSQHHFLCLALLC